MSPQTDSLAVAAQYRHTAFPSRDREGVGLQARRKFPHFKSSETFRKPRGVLLKQLGDVARTLVSSAGTFAGVLSFIRQRRFWHGPTPPSRREQSLR